MKFLLLIAVTFSFSLHAQEAEESEALRALRLSCEKHKVALGCYNYANLLLSQQKDNVEAIFKMGCDLGHQDSCKKKTWDSITGYTPSESAPESAVDSAAAVANEDPATASAPSQNVEENSDSTTGHTPASEDFSAPSEESAQIEAPKSEEPMPEDLELDLSGIE